MRSDLASLRFGPGLASQTALALLLASACGSSPADTLGASGTDGQTSGTDTTGTTAGDPTGGVSQSGTTVPTTSGASDSGDTDAVTTTASPSTSTTTTTTSPGTDTEPDTTTTTTTDTSTSDTTTTTGDTTDTGDTTMGADDTGTSTSTTEPDTDTGALPCGSALKATIRDFKFEHPDFEDYGGNGAYKGIVQVDLGPDMKPVYAHPGPTQQTSGPDAFAQWYNDTPGVNQSFDVDLPLTEVQPGLYQFADTSFFPIDGLGWGNEGGWPNNFSFTTEIHSQFAYTGGEIFTFIGDDDVWVFINGKLALDMGGLHPPLTDSIDLDASAPMLGITPGQSYTMDLFHAERRTDGSNFRIDTTIACFAPQ